MTEKCKTCKEYIWTWEGKHKCHPEFKVWTGDEGEEYDAVSIFSIDFETAATDWAEQFDVEFDYSICTGHPVTLFVKQFDVVKKFEVYGEREPTYTAEEKMEELS
jgi:hypothetical protein